MGLKVRLKKISDKPDEHDEKSNVIQIIICL